MGTALDVGGGLGLAGGGWGAGAGELPLDPPPQAAIPHTHNESAESATLRQPFMHPPLNARSRSPVTAPNTMQVACLRPQIGVVQTEGTHGRGIAQPVQGLPSIAPASSSRRGRSTHQGILIDSANWEGTDVEPDVRVPGAGGVGIQQLAS